MLVYFNKTELLRTVVKFEDLGINGGIVIESGFALLNIILCLLHLGNFEVFLESECL